MDSRYINKRTGKYGPDIIRQRRPFGKSNADKLIKK